MCLKNNVRRKEAVQVKREKVNDSIGILYRYRIEIDFREPACSMYEQVNMCVRRSICVQVLVCSVFQCSIEWSWKKELETETLYESDGRNQHIITLLGFMYVFLSFFHGVAKLMRVIVS